jgi:hypothetical protein
VKQNYSNTIFLWGTKRKLRINHKNPLSKIFSINVILSHFVIVLNIRCFCFIFRWHNYYTLHFIIHFLCLKSVLKIWRIKNPVQHNFPRTLRKCKKFCLYPEFVENLTYSQKFNFSPKQKIHASQKVVTHKKIWIFKFINT